MCEPREPQILPSKGILRNLRCSSLTFGRDDSGVLPAIGASSFSFTEHTPPILHKRAEQAQNAPGGRSALISVVQAAQAPEAALPVLLPLYEFILSG